MEVGRTNNHLCAWDLFMRHCEKEIEFERMSHKFYAKYIFKYQSFLVVFRYIESFFWKFFGWGEGRGFVDFRISTCDRIFVEPQRI